MKRRITKLMRTWETGALLMIGLYLLACFGWRYGHSARRSVPVGKQTGGTGFRSADREGRIRHKDQVISREDLRPAALRGAVMANDLKRVQRLLELGADINAQNDAGWTALMLLLQDGRSERWPMLHLLLQKGARINAHCHGKSNFWIGLYQDADPRYVVPDRREILKALLPAGLNVKRDGGALLVKAAFCGDLPVMEWLVEQGVDLHRYGPAALRSAAWEGVDMPYMPSLTAIRFLMDHGAYRPDAPDCRRAFVALAFNSQREVTLQMLRRGAGHHRVDLSEALVGACGGARSGPSTDRADLSVVKLLLQYGADPDGPDKARGCPIENALLNDAGDRSIVKVLLAHGANVNISYDDGMTLLMLAARQDTDIVRLLLRHSAHPNARSKDGTTPLNSVSDYPMAEPIRKLLLEAGAS